MLQLLLAAAVAAAVAAVAVTSVLQPFGRSYQTSVRLVLLAWTLSAFPLKINEYET